MAIVKAISTTCTHGHVRASIRISAKNPEQHVTSTKKTQAENTVEYLRSLKWDYFQVIRFHESGAGR